MSAREILEIATPSSSVSTRNFLFLCLTILLLITIVNSRGVPEVGAVFMIPAYLFVGTLFGTIALGLFRVKM